MLSANSSRLRNVSRRRGGKSKRRMRSGVWKRIRKGKRRKRESRKRKKGG